MGHKRRLRAWIAAALLAAPVVAAGEDAGVRRRLEELERKQEAVSEEIRELRQQLGKPSEGETEAARRQDILAEEVRRLREALVIPETRELKSHYGLGPAASKVYGIERGLSIGGYGEANYRAAVGDEGSTRDEFDFIRFVLYFGYKYNDWIVLNSEIELEHAFTKSTVSSEAGEVALEFATLDFLLHSAANARVGLLLVPMGFINEIHEPPFYHGNVRPLVETDIIPSTWRANGFGLFGVPIAGLQYRTYGLTGLNAKGFRAANVRDARQRGNREIAEDFAWVGRVDYAPLLGTLIGGSIYLGDSGQDQEFAGEKPGVFTRIFEGHAQFRMYGLEARALGAILEIDDADALSRARSEGGTPEMPVTPETVGERMVGYYFEVAYDVLPLLVPDTTHYLAPWFRYSKVDTHDSVPSGFPRDPKRDREVIEVGLSYKPIPQVVFKLDYRNQDSDGGDLTDELRVGGGFVF
ncbi:MAG: hypothetical protein ACREQQ_09045 [Candidatus Binatia bacterium]